MGKPLVVVDSEIKANTLQEEFKDDFELVSVSSAPMKISYDLSDDPEKLKPLFIFTPLPAAKSLVDKLLSDPAREIFLALDCDQQGEYWSWMITEYLRSASKGALTAKRLPLIGLGREEIRESFRLLKTVDGEGAVSFYIRRLFFSRFDNHLQRLLGTRTGPGNLPLTFNILTALFFLADREAEIQSFTPPLQWHIKVKLAVAGGEFIARLESADGFFEGGALQDAEQGRDVARLFKDEPFKVTKILRSEIKIPQPEPCRLTDLLQDAVVLYRISPGKVLDILDELFSGVRVENRLRGLISSFVPSRYNGGDRFFTEKIRAHVSRVFGEEALGVRDGEAAPGMNYIYPVRPDIRKEDLKDVLDEDGVKIYGLIHQRALAAQMREAVGENIEVCLQAGSACRFRASRRLVSGDKGFLAVCREGYEELSESCPLADLHEGQTVEQLRIIPEQTHEFPPEYYTIESLFADLRDFSVVIEPASVRMLQEMINGDYIKITPEGNLRCNPNVRQIINIMNRAFPAMTGINLSAYFEQTVAEVVSGRKPLDFAIKQFDQTMNMQGRVLIKSAAPSPGARLRSGRAGKIIKSAPGSAAVKETAPPPGPEESKAVPVTDIEQGKPAVDEDLSVPGADMTAPGTLPAAHEDEASALETAAHAEPVEPEPVDESPGLEESAGASSIEAAIPAVEKIEPPREITDTTISAVNDFTHKKDNREITDTTISGMETGQSEEGLGEEAAGLPGEAAEPPTGVKGEENLVKDCQMCGRPMVLKQDNFGRYWSCSGYPACRHAEPFTKKGAAGLMDCPVCGKGEIISKRTPTGKTFFVCPESNCEFMAWSQPHAVTCPVCNSPFLVEKKTTRGNSVLRCPRAGCNYSQPFSGDGGRSPDDSGRPKVKKVRVRRVAASGSKGGVRRRRVVVRRK